VAPGWAEKIFGITKKVLDKFDTEAQIGRVEPV
jgi:hypothetical protein